MEAIKFNIDDPWRLNSSKLSRQADERFSLKTGQTPAQRRSKIEYDKSSLSRAQIESKPADAELANFLRGSPDSPKLQRRQLSPADFSNFGQPFSISQVPRNLPRLNPAMSRQQASDEAAKKRSPRESRRSYETEIFRTSTSRSVSEEWDDWLLHSKGVERSKKVSEQDPPVSQSMQQSSLATVNLPVSDHWDRPFNYPDELGSLTPSMLLAPQMQAPWTLRTDSSEPLRSRSSEHEALSQACGPCVLSSWTGNAHYTISKDASWMVDAAGVSKPSDSGSSHESEDPDESGDSDISEAPDDKEEESDSSVEHPEICDP